MGNLEWKNKREYLAKKIIEYVRSGERTVDAVEKAGKDLGIDPLVAYKGYNNISAGRGVWKDALSKAVNDRDSRFELINNWSTEDRNELDKRMIKKLEEGFEEKVALKEVAEELGKGVVDSYKKWLNRGARKETLDKSRKEELGLGSVDVFWKKEYEKVKADNEELRRQNRDIVDTVNRLVREKI